MDILERSIRVDCPDCGERMIHDPDMVLKYGGDTVGCQHWYCPHCVSLPEDEREELFLFNFPAPIDGIEDIEDECPICYKGL